MAFMIIETGFSMPYWFKNIVSYLYLITLGFGSITIIVRYLGFQLPKIHILLTDLLILTIFGFSLYNQIYEVIDAYQKAFVLVAIIVLFLRELSTINLQYKKSFKNPAQLFGISFLILVIIGAFFLYLPNSTNNGIKFIDALFTSVSAVCVTGLSTVNTAQTFTLLGKSIILLLIQIGGLGIMTFASYFSFFFKGGTSYQNTLVLGSLTNSQQIGKVISTLKNIILVTFIFELIGAISIYFSIDSELFASEFERIYFSIFHSISSFNNAGFSTLPNGLYEFTFRFNYPLHLIISFLFILGGLGFPIVFNIFNYFKYGILRLINSFLQKKRYHHMPWVLNLNSRLILFTSFFLIFGGTILIFIFEYHHSLSEHNLVGKMVTAFFSATTPRTAGFNTIDLATQSFPTIMIIILLMWIGGSPASTAGGIKTSTFALATLNIISLAKSKNRIEIFGREISNNSIKRSFAAISLSLMVIGIGILIIGTVEPELSFLHIIFECFSAYSTVGLTLGITTKLTIISKCVLMLIMFIGRVSMLTILIALFEEVKFTNYKTPKEEILIN